MTRITSEIDSISIGLRTANESDRVALRGVRLRARVAGMSLKATLEQTFVNLEDRAIEAVYTFPLPEGAAVCGFEIVFFDRVFTGVVEETDRAIRKYDDAIADGDGAYLLEQHRPDVFCVRVGNLKPRQAVTVRLSYVCDVQIVDRSIRLSFPTTVAPRYATASGINPIDAAIDADALNPPHVLDVPYGLSMEVEIDLDKVVTGVSSPSHAIEATRGPKRTWEVRLAGGGAAEMDRDVVLNLALAKEQEPFALATTTAAGERFLAINFLPEFTEEDLTQTQSGETIFVLDCSGSMQGQSIAQATSALECCLRAMSAGERFNICRFGSRYELLDNAPLIYSRKTLEIALAFVRQPADLGGTELLAPLETILSQKPATSGVRNIVLLTDGQVSNENAVIALARLRRAHNRFFTFGIGTAASAFLVNGLARVTGGAAEFIAPGERIEEKVLRTFGRIASPPVTDLEIDFGNADAQVAPRVLPPLFDGDALRVFARLPGRIPETVTLRCNTASGPKSWDVAVREAADPASVLPALWARAMIRTIEEEDGVQQTASVSAPSLDRSNLVEISKRYNIVCGLTSFIAVEHRSLEDRNEGKPELRRVPVQLAAGWAGAGMGVVAQPGGAVKYRRAPARRIVLRSRASDAEFLLDLCRETEAVQRDGGAPADTHILGLSGGGGGMQFLKRLVSDVAKRAKQCNPPRKAPREVAALGFADDLMQVLAGQAADGSFEVASVINGIMKRGGIDKAGLSAAIERLLDGKIPASPMRTKVQRTLIVLVLLRTLFTDRQATWTRAFKKAIRFIQEKTQSGSGIIEDWLDDLCARVGNRPDRPDQTA
jgi:Ca-activated chloride channel family protein